jgi:hypothetical protein
MTATVTKIKPARTFEHHRFFLPDFQAKGGWLLRRLAEKYKNSSEHELASWIRSVTTSDQFLFVHTENAVALAQITREALSAKPRVKELFVLCANEENPEDYEEGAYLYTVMRDWAFSIGAYELIVETFSDVPRDMVKQAVRPAQPNGDWMFKRDEVFVKIG